MELITFHLETVDSTNEWAKRNLNQLLPHSLTAVTASTQTRGKGRSGRRWVSPKGENLYLTLCFHLQPLWKPYQLSLITASVAWEVLLFFEVKARIKWPNDLLIREKKVGGILGEVVHPWMILGVGINVDIPLKQLNALSRPATSIQQEGNSSPLQQEKLQETFLQFFRKALTTYSENGFTPFHKKLETQLNMTKGDSFCFHRGEKLLTARFLSLQKDGALVAETIDGDLLLLYGEELIGDRER